MGDTERCCGQLKSGNSLSKPNFGVGPKLRTGLRRVRAQHYRDLRRIAFTEWSRADAGPEFAEELMGFCQQGLAKIKCPRSVDFDKELPRHPTGKFYKRLLRDQYWVDHKTKII